MRADHLERLHAALLGALDRNGFEQMSYVYLEKPLEQIVPVQGRTLDEIARDLIRWSARMPQVGVAGLLAAALQVNPHNTVLLALANDWQGVQFLPAACPYPGMKPFKELDHRRFFGRSSEIEIAKQQLRHHRMLVAIGASGVGKSSLVHAGILPALRNASFLADDELEVHTIRPGVAPMAALAEALSCTDATTRGILECAIEAAKTAPTLLIVDQFEETFVLPPAAQAAEFQNALLELLAIENLYLILTVRADFYPELMESCLWDTIQRRRLEIIPLRGEALRRAIVDPAYEEGVIIEDALVERLIADVAAEPGALPFLQETLVLLWDHVASACLKLDAYDRVAAWDVGRSALHVAMARHGDRVFDALSNVEQEIAHRVLLRLVHFGEGRPDTRRQQTEAQLRATGDDLTKFETVLATFIANRLLTASGEEAAPERRIDIAHEALLDGWPRLRQWINEDRIGHLVLRRLGYAAEQWNSSSRNASYLYRGALLDEAEQRAREHPTLLNPVEVAFLARSRQQRWQVRAIWTGAILAAVILTSLAVLGVTGQLARLIYQPLPTSWVAVPAGPFTMGSTEDAIAAANAIEPKKIGDGIYELGDELPAHIVDVSEFSIMRFEVTRGEYQQCVNARQCSPSGGGEGPSGEANNYPVTGVNWEQARTYCKWQGGDLPTEAQWEKTARGIASSTAAYPWGDKLDNTRANVWSNKVAAVGSYPAVDEISYGTADMIGNVWEWVRDYYQFDYYSGERTKDPTGPETGDLRVLRGGAYDNDWVQARTTYRFSDVRPSDSADDVGFRCVR